MCAPHTKDTEEHNLGLPASFQLVANTRSVSDKERWIDKRFLCMSVTDFQEFSTEVIWESIEYKDRFSS